MKLSPINPIEPEVNVASFHGPLGERSVNVIATSNVPMAARVESDINQQMQDADVGNAWAKLEHSMLSKELEEE